MRQKNSSDNSWGSLNQNKIMTISITATMLRDCFISNSLRFQKWNKNKPRYRKKTSEQNLLQKKKQFNKWLLNKRHYHFIPATVLWDLFISNSLGFHTFSSILQNQTQQKEIFYSSSTFLHSRSFCHFTNFCSMYEFMNFTTIYHLVPICIFIFTTNHLDKSRQSIPFVFKTGRLNSVTAFDPYDFLSNCQRFQAVDTIGYISQNNY